MKRLSLAVFGSVLAVAALALVGCGGSTTVDTTKLKTAYHAAPATVKAHLDKAVAGFGAKNFPAGIRALRDAVKQAPPTDEQREALLDIIKQVQIIMAQNPKFDVNAAYEAIEELDAAIEGRPPTLIPKTAEPPR